MKMKHAELLRLKALSAKAAASLTADEVTELASLKSKAAAASIDLAKLDDAIEAAKAAEATQITDEDLTALIGKAVTAAMKESGVDEDGMVDKIKAAISAVGANAITPEKVSEIVKEHLGGHGIDQAALIAEITKSIPKDALTSTELAKALDKFAASIRQPSKMVFDDPYAKDFPIEHRSGNLSVAEKQLLNVCMQHVSPEKKLEMKSKGITIPTSMNDGITEEQLKAAQNAGLVAMKRARHQALYGKALTTSGAGSGAELIPTDLSGELMTRMYLESQLAAEFVASEIDMPTNPFMFPLTTDRTRFYTGSEAPANNPTASEPTTGDLTLTASKLIGMSEYSYEADEDAIIACLPLLLENMSSGAADALEGALINGDTTATHMDDDTAAGNHAKLFKGFRKLALAGSSKKVLTGGITAANIAAMRKQMLRWGIRPRDLMLICGSNGYNDIVNLAETLTFDKVGNANAARILTGEAGSIYGIRLVVSSQVREDLNATGVYETAGVHTQGSILMVHRPSWMLGVRRGFTVEVDVDKKRQINSVIASFRRAFMPKEPPSVSLPTVVLGYGYAA